MDIDERMRRFRSASCELFNHYFHSSVDGENPRDAEERFLAVEEELFRALVIWPEKLSDITSPYPHPQIQVKLLPGLECAQWWQLGRQDSGVELLRHYNIDRESVCLPKARLKYISFSDWDDLGVKENRFVRVLVESYPDHMHLNNTVALIDAQLVRFEKVD